MSNLRKRVEELERRRGKGECKTCAASEPITIVWGPRESDPEPCPECGELPIVIDWATR